MRQGTIPRLMGLAFLIFQAQLANASPLSTPGVIDDNAAAVLDAEVLELPANGTTLEKRCANPCGYYGQLCCAAGQQCYTDANNQAQCGGPTTQAAGAGSGSGSSGAGYWQMYTSTWVETDLVTRTSVYSTYIGGGTQATWYAGSATPGATNAPLNCASGQTSCGSICCAAGQYCVVSGQCGSMNTISASAPLRPTASTLVIQTATMATTTTVPFIAPVPTGASQTAGVTSSQMSGSGGLSGGAIAGIVIGVLAALVILFFVCVCLCFRELWHGLLALIGVRRGGRRKETVEVISRHGSRRDSRRWYGSDAPSRIERVEKKSGFGGMGKVLAGLGGFAIALGIKRKMDRRDEKSEVSDSYYSYDSASYTASSSSDRRTRDTRYTTRR